MKILSSVHVEPDDSVAFRMGGTKSDLPMLRIGSGEIYLNTLGDDLGPWLLALSDAAAEFAREVGSAPVESQPDPARTHAMIGAYKTLATAAASLSSPDPEPGTSPYYVAPDAYGHPCIWRVSNSSRNDRCAMISPFGGSSPHYALWDLITAAVDAAMSPEARARRDEAVAS